AAAMALKSQRLNDLSLTSFESDENLREPFRAFVRQEPSSRADLYGEILEQVGVACGVAPHHLKTAGRFLEAGHQWSLRGTFPDELAPQDRFHAILYDPFSA